MKENHDKPPAARPNKRAALPEVIRLAREGLNCREIAEKVGFSKTTVNRWLRAWRRKRAVKRAAESVEAIRHRIARYQVLADEFIDAWRRFQADEQMPLIEKTGAVEGPVADKKKVGSQRKTDGQRFLSCQGHGGRGPHRDSATAPRHAGRKPAREPRPPGDLAGKSG